MSLEELILSDYGNIPQNVGSYLLRHNSSTFQDIKKHTGLSDIQVRDALSVLIQRRIVRFFVFERTFKYFIDRNMVKRRMYFSIYLNYVSQNFTSKHTDHFMKVLLNGTLKESEINEINEELLQKGIFRVETCSGSAVKQIPLDSCISKHLKTATRFLTVNFSFLDQKVYEEEMIRMASKRYNESAGSVLRAVLKCEVADVESIIDNLESTKILITDKGSLVNSKENINEYLKYLCSSKMVIRGMDEKRSYFFNSSKSMLKAYRISLLLKDPSMRRIFNMIFHKPQIEDKDITIHSLLSVSKVKVALLSLQKLGIISQKCSGDYSAGSRIDHLWFVDIESASLSVRKRLEQEICEKMKKINSCWDVNHYFGSVMGNDNVWTSDLISLATDHLILGIE